MDVTAEAGPAAWLPILRLTARAAGSPGPVNVLAAVACAARIIPPRPGPSRFTGTPTAAAADEFCAWLGQAPDGEDACRRRMALVLTCTDPAPGTSAAQVLKTARSVHAFWTRNRLRTPAPGRET